MTRPSSSGGDNADPFGSELIFSGSLWDADECASMTITFYKKASADANDDTLTEIASQTATNSPQNWTVEIEA